MEGEDIGERRRCVVAILVLEGEARWSGEEVREPKLDTLLAGDGRVAGEGKGEEDGEGEGRGSSRPPDDFDGDGEGEGE